MNRRKKIHFMFMILIFTCSDLGNNESVFKDTQDTGGSTDMLVPPLPAKLLQSCPNLCSPMGCVTHQASLSMGLKKGMIRSQLVKTAIIKNYT